MCLAARPIACVETGPIPIPNYGAGLNKLGSGLVFS